MKRFGSIVLASVLAFVSVLSFASTTEAASKKSVLITASMSTEMAAFVHEVTPSYLLDDPETDCEYCPEGYTTAGEPLPPTPLWHGDKEDSACRVQYLEDCAKAWSEYLKALKNNCPHAPGCSNCFEEDCVNAERENYAFWMIVAAWHYRYVCVDGLY